MAILTLMILLAGCAKIPGFDDTPLIEKGTVGYVQGFFGGVVADEPHAVLVGRDVLAAGGTASDAAVAMYFMLSVSYPSAAGLGGGGICLIRDSRTSVVETLDFLGQPAAAGNGVPVSVPGNPRGFFALHAKYGILQWREVLRPAENAARFGVPMSRAFVKEVAAARTAFQNSPAARVLFGASGGQNVNEGDLLKQESLSTLLASIRNRGGSVIYSGALGRQFAQAAQESGAALSYADLQSFKPIWRPAIEVLLDIKTSFYLPMPRTPTGTLAAKSLALAIDDQRFQEADDGLRAHLIAEATQRALVDGGKGYASVAPKDKKPRYRLPAEYLEGLADSYLEDRVVRLAVPNDVQAPRQAMAGQTSFTAVDRFGGAVVCFVTMNARFGVARVARGTGAILAAPVSAARQRDLSAGMLIMSRRDRGIFYMAGSSSGGAMAQSALVQAALRAGVGTPDDLESALKRKRLFRDPTRAVTYVEKGMPQKIVNALRRRGHQLQTVGPMGRVHLIYCKTGLPTKVPACGMRSDPRGYGLATAP